jgi:hypothetical protein
MSFALRNLSVLAPAIGVTLWHCEAGADPLETLDASDYFAGAADMFAVGDIMADGVRRRRRTHAVHCTEPGWGVGDAAIGLIYRRLERRRTSRSCRTVPATVRT